VGGQHGSWCHSGDAVVSAPLEVEAFVRAAHRWHDAGAEFETALAALRPEDRVQPATRLLIEVVRDGMAQRCHRIESASPAPSEEQVDG
jgi:hypothetical protein